MTGAQAQGNRSQYSLRLPAPSPFAPPLRHPRPRYFSLRFLSLSLSPGLAIPTARARPPLTRFVYPRAACVYITRTRDAPATSKLLFQSVRFAIFSVSPSLHLLPCPTPPRRADVTPSRAPFVLLRRGVLHTRARVYPRACVRVYYSFTGLFSLTTKSSCRCTGNKETPKTGYLNRRHTLFVDCSRV